jgi:hypothetical protein
VTCPPCTCPPCKKPEENGNKKREKNKPCTAFLCNFLEGRCIKPKKVLRAVGLPTADLHDAFALQALYEAAQPYMPATVASDTDSAATDTSYDSQA